MTHGKSKKIEQMGPTRTAQHCAQCTAHGRISLLKGHKKVCPFKECKCVHCVLVNNKRQIMAKQVKLKRLQEKNHARQRRLAEKNASLRQVMANSPEKKYDFPNQEISDMQHYQEEAWRAICGPNGDMEQALESQVPAKCITNEQWCPISAVQYTHTNPLQQLQTTGNSAVILQPCYPLTSSTTALNLFTTPVGDPEDAIPLNHVLTQPVFYPCVQPGYNQNIPNTDQFTSFSNDSFLQPIEVVPLVGNGSTQSMDAAQTLLTLHTGEE